MPLCNYHKCPRMAEEGKKQCRECLDKAARRAREKRQNKPKGMCDFSSCKISAVKGRKKCEKHLKHCSKYAINRINKLKQAGDCARCAKPLPSGYKYKACSSCLAYRRDYSVQYGQEHPGQMAEWHAKWKSKQSPHDQEKYKLREKIRYAKKMAWLSLPANWQEFLVYRVRQLESSCQSRGIIMTITPEWAIMEFKKQRGKCGYQKCRVVLSTKVYKDGQISDRALSWDRIEGKDKETEIQDFERKEATPFNHHWNDTHVQDLQQQLQVLEKMDVDDQDKENVSPVQSSTQKKKPKKKNQENNPYSPPNVVISCYRCNCGRRHY